MIFSPASIQPTNPAVDEFLRTNPLLYDNIRAGNQHVGATAERFCLLGLRYAHRRRRHRRLTIVTNKEETFL